MTVRHIGTVQILCISWFSNDFLGRARMVNFALKRSFKWFTNVKAARLRAMREESSDSSSDPYFLVNIWTKNSILLFCEERDVCVCVCVCMCVCLGVGARLGRKERYEC